MKSPRTLKWNHCNEDRHEREGRSIQRKREGDEIQSQDDPLNYKRLTRKRNENHKYEMSYGKDVTTDTSTYLNSPGSTHEVPGQVGVVFHNTVLSSIVLDMSVVKKTTRIFRRLCKNFVRLLWVESYTVYKLNTTEYGWDTLSIILLVKICLLFLTSSRFDLFNWEYCVDRYLGPTFKSG